MRFTSTLITSASLALAKGSLLSSRSLSGEATFYGGNVAGGACSFSTYTLPSGIFGTALSDSNWDDSANCGACVAVTGPSGNTITAMIVDECPGCGENHLDLFPDAFSSLADPSKGIIDVTWNYVDCPISSALQLHNKEGVSAYWFSLQVVNADKAVKSLEVSTDGGSTWQATTRQTYNFFENSSGFGTPTVDVKVTSVDGDVVIVNNVEVSSGASVTASGNFASSGSTTAAAKSSPVSTSEVAVATHSSSSTTQVATKAPETSLATPQTTLPGANFQEISSSETSTYATSSSAVAVVVATPSSYSLSSPPSLSPSSPSTSSPSSSSPSSSSAPSSSPPSSSPPSSSQPSSQPTPGPVVGTKTETKTVCPITTSSSTPIAVISTPTTFASLTTSVPIPSSFSNTTTVAYSATNAGAPSSSAGGFVSSPTPSSIPFTGSASQARARIGLVMTALGLALLAAF